MKQHLPGHARTASQQKITNISIVWSRRSWLFFTAVIMCFSAILYATGERISADSAWVYDQYGYTQPAPGSYSLKKIASYGFDYNWSKYLGPAAVKAGKALDLDPVIIGAWVYSEGILTVFDSNCNDDLARIDKPCYSNNWQIGYGFRPFDGWINPSGQYQYLQKALNAMHPSESIHDIIVNTIQQNKIRSDEASAKYPGISSFANGLYKPRYITYPAIADVPANITVEDLWNKGHTPSETSLYRQLLFVLLMDDGISAYCEGAVLKGYAAEPKIQMADRMSWFTPKSEMAQALDYVSKLGLPETSTCVEDRQNELSAIYSETTFYDSVECDSANARLGISADGFVFPQITTKAKLKNYSNGNWLTCTNPISSEPGGSKNNPISIPGLCHHDYLAADIGNDTNTPVVAPRPGIIKDVSESSSGDNGLMIHLYSDKSMGGDGNWYYFAHCLPRSNKVSAGSIVKAGDQLAVVGTAKDAQGTYPHTHFDASPTENFFHRGGDGTEGPLLDVNPALKASYATLPEN